MSCVELHELCEGGAFSCIDTLVLNQNCGVGPGEKVIGGKISMHGEL